MKNPKKAFALLLTIFLITVFSLLSVYIIEIKTFKNDSQTKQYQQIQAKFHLDFAKEFINNLNLNQENQPCVNEITINNDNYEIFANISYISKKVDCLNSKSGIFDSSNSNGVAVVDLYVKSKSSIFNIKLHDRFLKKL